MTEGHPGLRAGKGFKSGGSFECSMREAPNAWRRIETAPKDGSVIDLFGVRHATGDRLRLTDCRWTLMSDWTGCEYEGWFLGRGMARNDFTPTHWMPLPEPPA